MSHEFTRIAHAFANHGFVSFSIALELHENDEYHWAWDALRTEPHPELELEPTTGGDYYGYGECCPSLDDALRSAWTWLTEVYDAAPQPQPPERPKLRLVK